MDAQDRAGCRYVSHRVFFMAGWKSGGRGSRRTEDSRPVCACSRQGRMQVGVAQRGEHGVHGGMEEWRAWVKLHRRDDPGLWMLKTGQNAGGCGAWSRVRDVS